MSRASPAAGGICRLAVAQVPPVFLDLAASVDRACELIAEASGTGAELVVFPETWLPGYPVWLDEAPGAGLWDHPPARSLYARLWHNAVTLGGPAVARLAECAAARRCHVVMGAQERRGGTLYNSMLFFGPDGAAPAVHRKLVPTYTERLLWGRGDGSTLCVVDTRWGSLGGLVCWEHWMPLARAAMHARGEVLHVAQWPWVKEMHAVASRHYAFEGGCCVVAAGGILSRSDVLAGWASLAGGESAPLLEEIAEPAGGLLLRGGSGVIDPFGQWIVEPVLDQPGIIYADVDTAVVAEARLALDTDGHYSRPDVFELRVDTTARPGVRFDGGEAGEE